MSKKKTTMPAKKGVVIKKPAPRITHMEVTKAENGYLVETDGGNYRDGKTYVFHTVEELAVFIGKINFAPR